MAREHNDIPFISERVKKLLKERKISQLKLAEDLSIDKDYLSQLLRKGKINKPLLEKISECLDCNPLYLLDKKTGYIPFSSYEGWQYDYMYCLRGLLHMENYNPGDFTLDERKELLRIIQTTIAKYADEHYKIPYSTTFWVPEDDD